MHTHVRVDDDAGTGDLSRRATGGDTPADTCSDTARISSTPWKFHESFARECRLPFCALLVLQLHPRSSCASYFFGLCAVRSRTRRGGSSGLVSVSVHGRSPLRARSPLGCLLVVGSKLDKSVIQLKQCVMRSVMRTTSARLGRLS